MACENGTTFVIVHEGEQWNSALFTASSLGVNQANVPQQNVSSAKGTLCSYKNALNELKLCL